MELELDESVYTVGELKKVLSTLPDDMPLELGASWYNNGQFQYVHRDATERPNGMGIYLEITDINGKSGLRLTNTETDDMAVEL